MTDQPEFLQYQRDRIADGESVKMSVPRAQPKDRCTWKGCTEPATNDRFSVNGERWAHLCDQHDEELEIACGPEGSVKRMLRAWVLAHGGAEQLA